MSDSDRGKDNQSRWVIPALIGMAIVLLFALGYITWATSDNWNASQQNARKIQAYAERYERERCIGLDVAEGVKCIADARKAAADQERDEADLYAQRQMAVWAFLVAITAFISIPLSLTGIFFVWRSLDEMRAQRTISQDALNAANEANAHTLEAIKQDQTNAQRQLRAYVLPDADAILDDLRIAVGEAPRGMLRFKNYGQTPAYDFVASTTTANGPWPIPDGMNLEIAPGNRERKVIAPSAISLKGFGYEGGGGFVTQAEFDLMKSGQLRFYVFGTATYRDVFFNTWRTEFCFAITPPTSPASGSYGIQRCHRHNDAT